jgi:hypothetical protein
LRERQHEKTMSVSEMGGKEKMGVESEMYSEGFKSGESWGRRNRTEAIIIEG